MTMQPETKTFLHEQLTEAKRTAVRCLGAVAAAGGLITVCSEPFVVMDRVHIETSYAVAAQDDLQNAFFELTGNRVDDAGKTISYSDKKREFGDARKQIQFAGRELAETTKNESAQYAVRMLLDQDIYNKDFHTADYESQVRAAIPMVDTDISARDMMTTNDIVIGGGAIAMYALGTGLIIRSFRRRNNTMGQ
jgi:hypothetical protein